MPEQAIPKLGNWLAQLSQKGSPNWEKGDRPVFRAAQAALLAIPGHAEFYRERIIKARAHLALHLTDPGEGGPAAAKWRDAQVDARKVLMNLPSPETVRVLGELLSETWIYPQNDDDGLRAASTAVYSLGALYRLPLANKPARTQHDHEVLADLPAWQAWFEQIKVGNRTFRFQGDSTEYDLNGPAPKEKLERIERDRKRDMERMAGERRSAQESSAVRPRSRASILGRPAGIVATCAMLLAVAAYWVKMRRLRRE